MIKSNTTPGPKKTQLQRRLRKLGNPVRMWSLLHGLPSPPYARRNAIIIETIGRKSGQRYRIPVGSLQESGKLIVISEAGPRASWVKTRRPRTGNSACFSTAAGGRHDCSLGRVIRSCICVG